MPKFHPGIDRQIVHVYMQTIQPGFLNSKQAKEGFLSTEHVPACGETEDRNVSVCTDEEGHSQKVTYTIHELP